MGKCVDIIHKQLRCSRLEASLLVSLGIVCIIGMMLICAMAIFGQFSIMMALILVIPPLGDLIICSKWWDEHPEDKPYLLKKWEETPEEWREEDE